MRKPLAHALWRAASTLGTLRTSRGVENSLDASLRSACATILLALFSHAAFAAVSGTVINKTTGKPQAGATVGLNKLDPQLGITLIDQAKSGADGSFTINQDVTGRMPYLIRTAFDGVTYNHQIPPGSPTSGLTLDVYSASKQPGAAKVTKHMVLFEPTGGQMEINETYLFQNDSQLAWNDPGVGTLHFFLPAGAEGKVKAQVTPPGSMGMAIGAPTAKTGKPDVFEVDYPVKPGETRFDLTYVVPYTEGQDYAGKIVTKDENTYLISPNGVTMAGEGLNDLGQEPKTQAHLYGFSGDSYKIQLTGAAVAAEAADSAASQQQQIEQIMPRLYDKVLPIIGIAFAILALGFALLYRAPGNIPAKESNERGRS